MYDNNLLTTRVQGEREYLHKQFFRMGTRNQWHI